MMRATDTFMRGLLAHQLHKTCMNGLAPLPHRREAQEEARRLALKAQAAVHRGRADGGGADGDLERSLAEFFDAEADNWTGWK